MAYRSRVTSAPALVNNVVDATTSKRNGSIFTLQNKQETTSQWLDDAITSAKRKIVEGTNVPIQDSKKKSKVIAFKREDGGPLSPVRDKENSPNVPIAAEGTPYREGEERVRIKIKPPASAVKRKVNGMRVVDLKKELKSKGIDTKGLKKDLQERLLKAYTTVEKIMSPPKPQFNNQSQTIHAEKKAKIPTEKDQNPDDSESVQSEVIVFSSSSSSEDDGQVMQMDTNPASTTSSPTESTSMHTDVVAKKEMKDDSSSRVDVPIKQVKGNSLRKAQGEETKVVVLEPTSDNNSSTKAMDIEPSEPLESSVKSSALDGGETNDASTAKPKRLSMMDCTESNEQPTKAEHGVPKVTLSVEPSLSQMNNPSTMETQNKAEAKEERVPGPSERGGSQEQQHGASSSRKVSQESISTTSVASHNSANSDKSSSAKPPATSSSSSSSSSSASESKPKDAFMESQEDTSQMQRAQSPIRRVQAAIQMFTAKSASKPVTKPMATPSKLLWMTTGKGQQHQSCQKPTNDLVPVMELPQQEAPKAQIQSQPKSDKLTATKASRRPGLQQSAASNATSTSSALTSSALKSNRFHSKATQNTATNEARKARIAEMREKSKPVAKPTFATTKDFSTATNTLSSIKNKTGTAAEASDKRKLLTAQMREKAAARKQMEMAAKQSKTVPDSSKQQLEKERSCASKPLQAPVAKAPPVERCTQPSQPMSSAKPATPSATKDKDEDYLDGLRPQLLSPMDTYEISDREDSDSESESESESEDETKNPRKKIPDWAQRANLLPALEKQFADGPNRIDPDEIFSEVQTCDLQAIFNSKRTRYLRRTSSGNWTKDKVTAMEKLTYKRTMGYENARKA